MIEKLMKDVFHLSFTEEVDNAMSHGVMSIGMLFLPFAAVYSYINLGLLKCVGVSRFVICLFIMFFMSTIIIV